MNRSFNFKRVLLALASLAAIAFAAPAAACYGYCPSTTPTPTPTPAPSSFNFTLTTGAAFQGEGFGEAVGTNRGVEVFKEGFGRTESSFNFGGNFCGFNCQNGSYTATGAAGEWVRVNGFANGANGARVTNGGTAAAMLQGGVVINKAPGTP